MKKYFNNIIAKYVLPNFFRPLFWAILLFVVGWLFWQAVVPGGKITYSRDFSHGNSFIRDLTPSDRVADGEDSGVKYIIGDPVYFTLRTPRTFDSAVLTVKFRRMKEEFQSPAGDWNSKLPVIEAGVLADKTVWRYDLKPLDNRIIDQLALIWDRTDDNGVMLLQRDKKFGSVGDFLAALPERSGIAVYNYDLPADFKLAGYRPSEKGMVPVLPYPLRGAYQFYTYIKSETLDFSFVFSDLNRNTDPDPVDIFLYYDNEMIDSAHLDDDGVTADSGAVSADRSYELKEAGLPEGVYKIEIKTNDDIVTKQVRSSQSKFALINKLDLLPDDARDLKLYTDSARIQALTVYPDRLQTIGIGNNKLALDKTYTLIEKVAPATASATPYNEIRLERDGVELSGDGVFAFSPEALVDPRQKTVDSSLDVNAAGIDYIIARYSPPAKTGEWYSATADFDLKHAYRENGAYSFIISIPGLRADDGSVDYVEIGEIEVELDGKTLFQKIKENF